MIELWPENRLMVQLLTTDVEATYRDDRFLTRRVQSDVPASWRHC
ncbi:MAG: hypothetical protein WCO82_05640 [Sphingomonadales bacterium]